MTAPNTKWALSDHQGTIKDIVDYNPATGIATVDRHRKYDPFGDRRGAALPTDIVFGYTGKYFDEVTGLQNNWNRWYDPKQGRFISQDPIGFAGGDENLYRYVGNGPTNATDPSGLETVLVALPGGVVRRIEVPDGNIGEIDNELHKIAESGSRSQESMQRAIELISLRQSIMAALDEVERARGMRPIIRGATPEEATRANAQYANQLISEMRRIDNNPFGIHIKEDRDYLDRRLAEIPGGYKAQYDYSRAVSGLQVAASTVVGTRRQPSATISPQTPQVIPLPAPIKALTGQIHHPISKTVFNALDRHPILKGHYRARDPRFTTQAIDKAAHNGYQRWHIDLDNEVASWVNSNPAATPAQFESWLRWRYSQPDLVWRFPNGF